MYSYPFFDFSFMKSLLFYHIPVPLSMKTVHIIQMHCTDAIALISVGDTDGIMLCGWSTVVVLFSASIAFRS